MKILSFGYIPSNFGGRQSSGLANVIYQLAYHVAKLNGVEMILAATDVFVPELHKDGLTILGWTKGDADKTRSDASCCRGKDISQHILLQN